MRANILYCVPLCTACHLCQAFCTCPCGCCATPTASVAHARLYHQHLLCLYHIPLPPAGSYPPPPPPPIAHCPCANFAPCQSRVSLCIESSCSRLAHPHWCSMPTPALRCIQSARRLIAPRLSCNPTGPFHAVHQNAFHLIKTFSVTCQDSTEWRSHRWRRREVKPQAWRHLCFINWNPRGLGHISVDTNCIPFTPLIA